MVSKGHALAREALVRTLTAYSGITTEDGLGDGTTLVDANLIDNPFISPSGIPEKTILILSGDARGEDKGAASFNNDTGAITLQGTGFSAQIKAGTVYRVLNISTVEIDVANIDAKIDTLLTRLSAARAGYLDALNRDRPSMIFPSATPKAIIAVPAVGNVADLAFPDVEVASLPLGLSIARVDIALIIGALFDTSAAENQIAAAAKTLRVKLSTGAWGTNDIVALTFVQNSLQVNADAYRGGVVLFGGIDIKSIVTANGTYNFRSDQTERTDAVIATGDTLELLDVSIVIRVWFN